jgi:hypothetical protein
MEGVLVVMARVKRFRADLTLGPRRCRLYRDLLHGNAADCQMRTSLARRDLAVAPMLGIMGKADGGRAAGILAGWLKEA